ncbi:uncharacterized protein LOC110052693 isoform X5 [Orbicella faveolata]|uniref:uncharacterized protein LOC110052693 isoform X5 n=1 Tax=Orbicella faveolata TaxID=48498 RepID=UPI0009E34E33|nr:uncharacterized protein LOC110052693 isoform X5 [Orbicella faveolata]
MSGSVKSSDLPSAVASQIHERHNYQREDTQRSFGHSGPPSFLKYCQPPFPAGPQTQAQTYQTSHPQSSSGHGRPPSLVEHKQLPFPAVPQTPAQTYQTSHPQSHLHYWNTRQALRLQLKSIRQVTLRLGENLEVMKFIPQVSVEILQSLQ